MFTYDASFVVPSGAVVLRPGKQQRLGEIDLHTRFYEAQGIPVLGAIDAPGTDRVMAVDLEGAVTRVGPVSPHQRQAVKDRLFSLGELMSVEGLHP